MVSEKELRRRSRKEDWTLSEGVVKVLKNSKRSFVRKEKTPKKSLMEDQEVSR